MFSKLCGFIFWTWLMLTQVQAIVVHTKDAGQAAMVGILAWVLLGLPIALVLWLLIRRENARLERNTRLRNSMYRLKDMTKKLGSCRRDFSKRPYELHFGKTKMNDDVDIVDAIGREDAGMTATLFLKEDVANPRYVAVSTSVLKANGGGRAVGSILGGEALEAIERGKEFMDKARTIHYEPIITRENYVDKTIGAYCVGLARAGALPALPGRQ